MDIGCGMDHFTIGLAELVGEAGRVIAVDLQQQMLDVMLKRARKRGLDQRIISHRAQPDSICIATQVEFILAFWMIHEVSDPAIFFREVAANLKPSAKLLYTEPTFHVTEKKFNEILATAYQAGLKKTKVLTVRFSRAALLERTVKRLYD